MSKSFWIYSSLLFGLVFIGLIWAQLNFDLINMILIILLLAVSIVVAITYEEKGETLEALISLGITVLTFIYMCCFACSADFLKIMPIKIGLSALIALPFVLILWGYLKKTLEEEAEKKIKKIKSDFNLNNIFADSIAKEIIKIKKL